MQHTQNKKNDILLCTYGKCYQPQTEDGEFCEKHYPKPKERGEASILIELKDGNITVWHGTEDKEHKTPLLEIPNAKAGSWDKIWKTLKSLK